MHKTTILLLMVFLLLISGCTQIGERQTIDIQLPSQSVGPNGNLAVRIISPASGAERYDDGAPIIIYMQGGYEIKGINNDLPITADDIIIVTFIYPGGSDSWSGLSSDGEYDWRGEHCITALRDVILFCAGKQSDSQGKTIDEIIPATILHDNIGLIGVSNGGNILVAVAAYYGHLFDEHLQYIIQWETPVNSQIACRDLGRVVLNWTTVVRGDYDNPYYNGYNYPLLDVDCSNLVYKEGLGRFQIFHDGNGDGEYTTIEDERGVQTPDINENMMIDDGEDFPVGNYTDGTKYIYSRKITRALSQNNVFNNLWPTHIANVSEANEFWDIRESVVLYDDAIANIPQLEAMILASVDDHVQKEETKPHVRLAFDGWKQANAGWVKINPDKQFLVEVDKRLENSTDIPKTMPNQPPSNWTDHGSYCYPEHIYDNIVQLAAIYEMADRAYH